MLMSFGIVWNLGLVWFRKVVGLLFLFFFCGGFFYLYFGVFVNYCCKCYIVFYLIIDCYMVGRKLY